jgi:hypothetical protein
MEPVQRPQMNFEAEVFVRKECGVSRANSISIEFDDLRRYRQRAQFLR